MARPRKRKANPDPIAPSMVIAEPLVIDSGYVHAYTVHPLSREFDPVATSNDLEALKRQYPEAIVLEAAKQRAEREARKS